MTDQAENKQNSSKQKTGNLNDAVNAMQTEPLYDNQLNMPVMDNRHEPVVN